MHIGDQCGLLLFAADSLRATYCKLIIFQLLYLVEKNRYFRSVCRAVGIPCRVVKGKVKGSGYRLGGAVEGTNDYCIVYVDNSWRFVDPHWGSQFTISSVDNNDDWEMIRPDSPTGGAGDKKDSSEKQEEQFGYNCDDFYFLTDPVAMVYTHLTCDPKHQVGLHWYFF